MSPMEGKFEAGLRKLAEDLAAGTLLAPKAEPDHLLGDFHERKMRIVNMSAWLRQQAQELEQLSHSRELTPLERNQCHYAASSCRLAGMQCLADAREWLEKLIQGRRAAT